MQKIKTKPVLSRENARILIDFAMAKSSDLGVGAAIAVVDDGGHLICLDRIDGTMPAAANIAMGKAATCVCFKRPGIMLEQTVTTDRPAMLTLNSVSPFPYAPLKGSYPVIIDGQIIGGIAVAGAETADNDELIALYAIEKFMDI